MSLDANDFEFTYWPITGLVEGESTEPITFKELTGVKNSQLQATEDDKIIVWARRKGVGASYQNIITTPINIGPPMPDAWTEFELYVEALGPIPDGVYVATSYVGPIVSKEAGWSI